MLQSNLMVKFYRMFSNPVNSESVKLDKMTFYEK